MSIVECIDQATPCPRVLFFGRSCCDATEKALTFLKTLNCEITFVISKGRGEELPCDTVNWDGEYIFCFRSFFILPKHILDKAKIAAVNFHPAPVEYPGSGCINFALYNNAKHYGVTAHLMNEKIDNGAILECKRFLIFPMDTLDSLLQRTHHKLLDLFFEVVTDLILGGKEALDQKILSSSDEKWTGPAIKNKEFEKLKNISVDISEGELEKVIRATYTEKFPPYIKLYGYDFLLKSPQKRL